jgi:hypothetical protein
MTADWPPTLDEDTSQRAQGEKWRARYNGKWGIVYVEAIKVDGCVYVAPLGSDLSDPMVWVRIP